MTDFVPGVPHVPRKDDATKPPVSLVPPRATLAVAAVMGFGAQKYGANNYLAGQGIDPRRLIDAAMRHLCSFNAGEATDAESGLPHLAHATASLMMAMEVMARGTIADTWKRKEG